MTRFVIGSIENDRDIGFQAFQEQRTSDGPPRQCAPQQAVLFAYLYRRVVEGIALRPIALEQRLRAGSHHRWSVCAGPALGGYRYKKIDGCLMRRAIAESQRLTFYVRRLFSCRTFLQRLDPRDQVGRTHIGHDCPGEFSQFHKRILSADIEAACEFDEVAQINVLDRYCTGNASREIPLFGLLLLPTIRTPPPSTGLFADAAAS